MSAYDKLVFELSSPGRVGFSLPESDVPGKPLAERQILAGYPLGRDYPELADALLLCCTEANTRAEIDRLIEALGEGR